MRVAADAERVATAYLGTIAELDALVADRIRTVLPTKGGDARFPMLRIVRVGGSPSSSTAHLDRPLLQVDAYGGSKYEARTIAATAQAALVSDQIAGFTAHGGYVTGSEVGSFRYDPDVELVTDAGNNRPRYRFDTVLYIHPAA